MKVIKEKLLLTFDVRRRNYSFTEENMCVAQTPWMLDTAHRILSSLCVFVHGMSRKQQQQMRHSHSHCWLIVVHGNVIFAQWKKGSAIMLGSYSIAASIRSLNFRLHILYSFVAQEHSGIVNDEGVIIPMCLIRTHVFQDPVILHTGCRCEQLVLQLNSFSSIRWCSMIGREISYASARVCCLHGHYYNDSHMVFWICLVIGNAFIEHMRLAKIKWSAIFLVGYGTI